MLLEYMDEVHERGFSVEKVLPKLSAFMCVGMNFFEEIAKFRALKTIMGMFAERTIFRPGSFKIGF